MSGKICIVTGASSGIGKITARSLAGLGAIVLMVCRNKNRGEAALKEIAHDARGEKPRLLLADLSSQQQIRTIAAGIKSEYPRIDVLVNNAGTIRPSRELSADGIEMTLAVNHLSFFLLTLLLIDQCTAAGQARIVNVSSEAHRYGGIHFDDLGLEKKFNPARAYAQSKLANIMFTYELARRLRFSDRARSETSVTVNTVHPGAVHTNFGTELHGIPGFFFRHLGFLMRSPEKGAETVVWLATSPDVKGFSGRYFHDRSEIRSSRISYDEETGKRLWNESARLTGLQTD